MEDEPAEKGELVVFRLKFRAMLSQVCPPKPSPQSETGTFRSSKVGDVLIWLVLPRQRNALTSHYGEY